MLCSQSSYLQTIFHPYLSLYILIDLLPFSVSQLRPKAQELYAKLDAFMKEKVYPVEKEILTEKVGGERWQPHPKLEELKVCIYLQNILLCSLKYYRYSSKERRLFIRIFC